jgi:hypothetical protein
MLLFGSLFIGFFAVFVRAAYYWLDATKRAARVAPDGAIDQAGRPDRRGRKFADYSGFDQDRILRLRCESWEVN